ncbi:ankyrin repeat domain-containing protein 24 [Crotalus adamanteus]|uniref:Ankyrin repeat domain-containing protein 24 n=1 Tax=Crotalus adamanteus TaxID=8729 RepID=A0AAW1C5V6_CROAD
MYDLQRRLAETANEKESLRKELEVLRSRFSLCENDKENTSYDVEILQDEEGEMLELPAAAELLSKKSLSASTEELLATLQSQIESLTRKNKKLMEKIEVLEKDESEADPSEDVIPVVLYDSLRSEFEKLKAQQLEAQELLKSLESQGTDESPPKPISAEAYEQRLKDDYEKQIAALKQALEKINCPGDPIGLNQATESEADLEPEGQSNFKRWGREETEELTKELRETQEKYQAALAEVKLLEDQIELGILSVEDKEAAESSSIELQTVKAALHQTREELKERDQKVKDLEGLLRVREERGAQACEEMKATLGASLDAVSKEKEALLQRCTSVETELRELRASLQEEKEEKVEEEEEEEEKEKQEKKNSHQMLEGRSSISQALQETSKLREQLEAMTEQRQEAKAHVEELREGREKLEEELQATKEMLASEYIPRAEHKDTVEKLKAAFSEAEERLLEMKEKYTSTRTEMAELQKSTEVYRRESIPLTEHVRAKEALEGTLWELKAKAKLVEQELRAKSREASRLQADLDELRRGAVSKEAHEQLRAASWAESEALRAKLSDLGRKHERTCTEVFHVQREALFMKSEKQAAEAQLASAEKQLQSLRAESERLQELHSHVEDSAELLKEKDKTITELSKEVLKLKEAPKDLSELSSSASSKGIFSPKADSDLDVATFQSRIKDLEQQLIESERRHSNIVSLYRGHLLYAIQGNMDEDVQKMLFQILKMQRLQEQGR